MASKIKVDQLETADGSGTIALQNQLSGMTTASLPALTTAQMPSGTWVLAAHGENGHSTQVSLSGTLTNGDADGQKNCIVINNGLYMTFTPAATTDLFAMSLGCNVHYNNANDYLGLGVQIATNTSFSANRATVFSTGQHATGNGSWGGDPYIRLEMSHTMSAANMGMSAGTTYYMRIIGQKHSSNGAAFGNSAGGGTNGGTIHISCMHFKKIT